MPSGGRAAHRLIKQGFEPVAEMDRTLYFTVPEDVAAAIKPDRSWRGESRGNEHGTAPTSPPPRPVPKDPAPAFVTMRHRERRLNRLGARFLACAAPFAIAAIALTFARDGASCGAGQTCNVEGVDEASYLTLVMAGWIVAALTMWIRAYRLHKRAGRLEAEESKRMRRSELNRTPGWRAPDE